MDADAATAKRPATERTWRRALAAVLVAPFLLLGPALFPGRVLSVADGLLDAYLLTEMRPPGHRRANELQTDPYRVFLPWRSVTTSELRAGRLPFWNPYAYAGSPLLGNGQSGVLDPLCLPYLLVEHASRATVWVALLRMLVAGAGAFLLAQRLGASPPGSAIAGIVYAWGGFSVAWVLYPLTSSSAWLPWALLAAEHLVAAPTPARTGLLAVPLALAMLGGHLEVAFFVFAAVGAYAVLRALGCDRIWATTTRRRLGAVALAGALGGALAAVQVLPFLEALEQSEAVSARASGARTLSVLSRVHPERVVLQVFPYLQGRPVRDEVGFWTPDTVFNDQVATYGSVLGLVLALTALLGSRRGSPTRALGAVGLVAWLYFVGLPPLRWLGTQLPVLQLAKAERVAPVALCAVAVLAALGLDRLRGCATAPAGIRFTASVCVTAGALGLAVGLAMLAAGEWVGAAIRAALDWPGGRSLVGAQADTVLAGLDAAAPVFGRRYLMPWGVTVMASGLLLRRLDARARPRLATAAAFVVAADLFCFGVGFNPAIPVAQDFPQTRALDEVRAAAAGGRALMLDGGLPANAATHYRIPDVLGYDALDRWRLTRVLGIVGPFRRVSAFPYADSWVHDLLAVRIVTSLRATADGDLVPAGRAGGGHLFINPSALPLAFVPTSVVVVPDADAAERELRAPAFDPARVAVVESSSPLDAAVTVGTIAVSRPEPARIRLDAFVRSPGVIVVSEGYDPGWIATIGGAPTPVLPANLAVMAVSLPAGRHTVELRYRPRSWAWATALSAAGLLILAVVGIRSRRHAVARARRPVRPGA